MQLKEKECQKGKPAARLATQAVVLAAIKIEQPDAAKAPPKSEKE